MINFQEDSHAENHNSTVKLNLDGSHNSQLIQLNGAKRISPIQEKLMISSRVLLRTSKDSRTYLLELLQSSEQLSDQLDKVEVAGKPVYEFSQINSLQEFSVNQCHYVILHPSSFYIRSRHKNADSRGQSNQYHQDLIQQYPILKESLCNAPLSNAPINKNRSSFKLQKLLQIIGTLVCIGAILLLLIYTAKDKNLGTEKHTDGAAVTAPDPNTSNSSLSTDFTNDFSRQMIAPPLNQAPNKDSHAVASNYGADHLTRSTGDPDHLDSDQNAKNSPEVAEVKFLKKPPPMSNQTPSWKKQETLKTIASYVLEAGFDPERARKRLTRLKQQTKDPDIIMRINENLLQLGYQP